MANSLQAPYRPHASVIALPIYQRSHTLRSIIGGNSVGDMAEDVVGWKRSLSTFSYRTMVAAIEWDLRTHYGLGDRLLGPPIG